MEYHLKSGSIEAWKVGSEPVPGWVETLIGDKTITTYSGDSATFSVVTDDGAKAVNPGDYISYTPTVWGEPTEDLPQGPVLAVRSVRVFDRQSFETYYDVPAYEAQPLTASEAPTGVQPAAAEDSPVLDIDPSDLEPAETEKPRRKR